MPLKSPGGCVGAGGRAGGRAGEREGGRAAAAGGWYVGTGSDMPAIGCQQGMRGQPCSAPILAKSGIPPTHYLRRAVLIV